MSRVQSSLTPIYFQLQRAVQESGERGRGDEKLQQTIQLSLKRLDSYMRVSIVVLIFVYSH